jgi:hypothetical protein
MAIEQLEACTGRDLMLRCADTVQAIARKLTAHIVWHKLFGATNGRRILKDSQPRSLTNDY